MFEKIKSFFGKNNKKAKEPTKEIEKDFQIEVGEKVYPVLRKALEASSNPEGISNSDWKVIKEKVLWSFSALRAEKKPLNNIKKREHQSKIQDGLILFAKHVDNFKL